MLSNLILVHIKSNVLLVTLDCPVVTKHDMIRLLKSSHSVIAQSNLTFATADMFETLSSDIQ